MQEITDPAHQPQNAASVEKILHQILSTRRAHVADHWNTAAGGLEIIQPNVAIGAAGHSDEVDDGVG